MRAMKRHRVLDSAALGSVINAVRVYALGKVMNLASRHHVGLLRKRVAARSSSELFCTIMIWSIIQARSQKLKVTGHFESTAHSPSFPVQDLAIPRSTYLFCPSSSPY